MDHFKESLLTIHRTANGFHDMWKKACVKAVRCIAEAKEYQKHLYDKTHKEPEFREGDQVLVSTLNFNNLKVPKKIRYSFVGPLTMIRLKGRRKSHTPQDIVEVENSPGPVKKIMKAMKIILNQEDHRQYLVRFKNQTADKDKFFAEDAIPDVDLYLRQFRSSRKSEQSHQL
ncbi:hypothetical protein O181_124097 [Austropuccinia psidii MF-1]|uniref:Uncharacterized protein n=1 Tax=Austropuccinia psidii MF-1 TaxID=1389203 RepID=A0A9Q3KNZ7_9BASI|nr:hypothetical protein [Austropuccinia psidii MF-1]